MSRIGKLPITIPKGTEIKIEKGIISVKGPKGQLTMSQNRQVKVDVNEDQIIVSVKKPEDKFDKSLWGLYRSLINNMIQGVNSGFEKKLEVNGVGFKAAANGKKINLNLGFSHPIEFELPEGINGSVEGNVITISGINKQEVGEIAAKLRRLKKPEPYKGKGIKYQDEVIRRKEGKTASKGA
jgi:large subunit ribosomal protein L6